MIDGGVLSVSGSEEGHKDQHPLHSDVVLTAYCFPETKNVHYCYHYRKLERFPSL